MPRKSLISLNKLIFVKMLCESARSSNNKEAVDVVWRSCRVSQLMILEMASRKTWKETLCFQKSG